MARPVKTDEEKIAAIMKAREEKEAAKAEAAQKRAEEDAKETREALADPHWNPAKAAALAAGTWKAEPTTAPALVDRAYSRACIVEQLVDAENARLKRLRDGTAHLTDNRGPDPKYAAAREEYDAAMALLYGIK